ncbi:MAG: site-specific integrase [Candidatus Bathyarchaeota archaeon]|nr:MAG: site-specific integrase [Candidatus Bathyarchaeota archaeon]
MLGITWKPPKCNYTHKLPFIPTEEEVDALIAACGKKLATFLKTLKETGARAGEAIRLEWIDVNDRNATITINQPEKGGNPRIIKVSSKLIAMLKDLPHTEKRVFGSTLLNYVRSNFTAQRKRIAQKLKNPRLKKIHFHTFRHWKATMEYHKTKDIIHVQQLLGHKNINNTMLYTQLIHFEGDEYHVKVAKTLEEVKELLTAGFEYVKDHDGISVFRKRK